MDVNPDSLVPPPPYSEVDPTPGQPQPEDTKTPTLSPTAARSAPLAQHEARAVHVQPTQGRSQKGPLQLPIVIPQTTKAARGAFYSPFCRAVPVPGLGPLGIDNDTFLSCIDGLNEAFIANPAFIATGIAGNIMGQFYGFSPVQWAGMGVQVTSGVASAATSYLRTRAYVKALNTDLLNPVGLRMQILSTKKMLATIGRPSEELTLPPLQLRVSPTRGAPRPRSRRRSSSSSSSSSSSVYSLRSSISSSSSESSSSSNSDEEYSKALSSTTSNSEDPRQRRMRAMEGLIMPLDFDNIPPAIKPENLLRRMGDAYAKKQAKKQNRRMDKRRVKAERKMEKRERKASRRDGKSDNIRHLEQDIAQAKASHERAMADPNYWQSEKERAKADRHFQKELAKRQRRLDKHERKRSRKESRHADKADSKIPKVDRKEHKTAQKIRWVVISNWNGEEEDEVDEAGEKDVKNEQER